MDKINVAREVSQEKRQLRVKAHSGAVVNWEQDINKINSNYPPQNANEHKLQVL